MSLFKVRDFWTFDLSGLQLETSDADSFLDPDVSSQEGAFTASIGRFNSIGQQDVFVCGNLQGSIFIVQVPLADQRKYIKAEASNEAPTKSTPGSGSGSGQSLASIDDRQLLASTSLKVPIVDIKCGYFLSAARQSIAVLSFDRLLILQVKRHDPVDLITDSEPEVQDLGGGRLISPGQLTHEFEEYLRLDLLANEFACGLVVLNSHADSSLKDASNEETIKEASADLITIARKSKKEPNKFIKQSKLIVQHLHLPQRDKLIVQYVNQFLFSLVDGKKITGHFSINQSHQESSAGESDAKAHQNPLSIGAMPMAYLHKNKSSPSIVLSFSDYTLHCVPLEKLVSQARQDVMKRVATNLLHNGEPSEPASSDKISSLAYADRQIANHSEGIVSVDIDSISEWTYEMLSMPLQMLSEQRQAKNVTATGHKNDLTISQLFVMTRYSFDLFSACGQHFWSQRFETPLIRGFSYVIETPQGDTQEAAITIDGGKMKVQFCDKLISLLSTDSLSAGKSNLLVLEGDRVQWSALLNAKPYKIWRLNLTHMPGLLAMLDMKQGQLIVSYLGTNTDPEGVDDDASDLQEDIPGGEEIAKLETLDEPLLASDAMSNDTPRQQNVQSEQRRRLVFEVSLEASGKWPNVAVDSFAAIRLDPESTGVIHDIVATFEYDDLLRFELSPSDDQSIAMLSYPSPGVARLKLGNCWPDRKEPILLRGNFNLAHSHRKAFGMTAMEELESNIEDLKSSTNSGLLPKSLKVQVVLSYHETHSSLLIQDESFLLPISMISQLTHIDYTNGNGQNIEDVLNNLGDYKGPTGKSAQQYQFCDLFLQLELDMVEFLNEFVERDLVCRRSNSNREKLGEKRNKLEEQVETLENINLLAQSLDCRLRYKSPGGVALQSSEEIIVPAMASFAIRVHGAPSLKVIHDSRKDQTMSNDVVWIHVCDLNSANSSLIAEFVTRHMKDWMQYAGSDKQPEVGAKRAEIGANNLLVSIECETSWPLMFVLDHLLTRAGSAAGFDARTAVSLIQKNDQNGFESVHEATRYGHHLAISTTLHNSLRTILNSYETRHGDKFSELCDKLAREECKFYIATRAILSLSKRLSSLPDEMASQFTNMGALVKHCQQSIATILNEMSSLKETDFYLSKLPYVPSVKVRRLDKSDADEMWPCLGRFID